MTGFVSEATLHEIGRIVVATAELDADLAAILNDLLDSDRASLLVAGQPYAWLDQAIRVVVKQAWTDEDKTLIGLLDRAKMLHAERDLVVHGLWLPTDVAQYLADEDPAEYHTVRPRRWSAAYRGKQLSNERLVQLADDIEWLEVQLRKWREDYLPALERQYRRAAPTATEDRSGGKA